MKHLKIAAIALMLAVAPALSGCAWGERVFVAATTASENQSTTVYQATLAETVALKAATAYLQSGKATVEQAKAIKAAIIAVHEILKAAQAADASGDSALAGALVQSFNLAIGGLNKTVAEAKGAGT